MGFFIRPKSSTSDDERGLVHVEAIGVVQDYEDEYIPTSGFDSDENGAVARHNRDPKRREAPPGYATPTGSWRGAVSRNVSSGFGRGTRAGKTGTRR